MALVESGSMFFRQDFEDFQDGIIEEAAALAGVRVQVDVDPLSFL